MDSQIFLVEFSNNDHIVTIDRCSHYDQLVRETVKAINGSIQAQDIDSYQYDALFGEECITITVKNSKALFRIPNKPYYKLKMYQSICLNRIINHYQLLTNLQQISKSIQHTKSFINCQYHQEG